jgi:hypothetical protein
MSVITLAHTERGGTQMRPAPKISAYRSSQSGTYHSDGNIWIFHRCFNTVPQGSAACVGRGENRYDSTTPL